MKFVRENSLSIVFGVIFLLALGGQAIAGHADYDNEQIEHAELLGEKPETVSFGRYVTSSAFGQAVMENWQSEYLQFALFILGTIWLLQRGSPESKELDPAAAGRQSEQRQRIGQYAHPRSPLWARVGGVRTFIYSNSLLLVMFAIFFLSWFAHSVTGWTEYNNDQADHEQPKVSWLSYLGTANFWESTLQNWQSEFLAVGSFAILAVYLRQRGSPASKPVGAPHVATGVEG
jgi:hypothetical protein